MAVAKINDAEYDTLLDNILKASESLSVAMEDIWGTKFDDLNQAYFGGGENGFINQVYKDAESNWVEFRDNTNIVCSALGAAATGVAIAAGWTGVGAIVAAIIAGISLVLGFVIKAIDKNNVQFNYDALNAFYELMQSCVLGNDDNYTRMINLRNKLDHIYVGLCTVRNQVNDFNHVYANLETAMEAMKLKGQMADDGVTMLGVETTVTIDGKELTTSVSEAMNAFFTYNDVVINTEIEADYLERTYGIEVDYKALMDGFSGFMTNTLNSGLYSHEFVEVLVPAYVAANPNIKEDAYEQVAGEMGTTSDKVKSILGELGLTGLGLGGALLGSSLLSINDLEDPEKPVDPPADNPVNPPGDTNPPGSTNPPGGTVPTTPGETDEEDKPEEGNTETFETPEELELPEELKAEIEKDYDDLAREAYEAQGSEAISQKRFEMIDEINQNFNNGDLSMYDEKLASYGYDQAAIEALKVDRDMLITALVLGDERATLAALAQDLAKADGVNDFQSQYATDAKYESLSNGEASETLVNMSDNPTIQEKREAMKKAEKEYTEAVDGAKESYDKVVADKKAMEDAYNAAKEKYGEDTSKWSEADAKSYNELVKNYNESAKAYQEKAASIETAKTNYQTARDEYNVAKDTFLESIRSENDISGGSTTSAPVEQASTSTLYQGNEGNQTDIYNGISDGSMSIGISDEEILNSINN